MDDSSNTTCWATTFAAKDKKGGWRGLHVECSIATEFRSCADRFFHLTPPSSKIARYFS